MDVAIVGASIEAASYFANPAEGLSVFSAPVKALVDTGATSTSISRRTAETLGLAPVGKRDLMTANGPQRSRVYHFQIAMLAEPGEGAPFFVLPDLVEGIELNSDELVFDILLGMDVISQGDLLIRRNGAFSFEF